MIKSILKSFLYALRGVSLCIKNERNFRIHLAAIIYVSFFAVLYKLEITKTIILLLTFAIVLFAEMINTAIETLIDMNAHSFNNYARNAKDIAAGAVMVCAIVSVIIAVFMFGNIERIKSAIETLFSNYFLFGVFLISIIPAAFFVRGRKK